MEEARNPSPSASPSKSTRGRSQPTKGKDLISALSDEVILHVLSFLDVKDVVKTSVLSKRWSPLWTKTFAISVEFWKMPGDIDDQISYIRGYLAHCTSPAIQKFHLRDLEYHVELKESIDKLFSMAVERSIKDLCIEFSETSDAYLLPMVLLRCQSLTNLRLSFCRFPYSSIGNLGTTSWKLLKVLSVHRSYMPDEVINVVLEGSPQLESLALNFCYGMDSIRILSRMMRELVISGYCDPREDLDDDEFQIHRYFVPHEDLRDEDHDKLCLEIFAPYLRTLRLLCSWKGKEVVLLQEASSLVEVELNFSLTLNETNHDIIDNTMKGILSELHCVDKFIVGNAALEVLRKNKGNGDFSLQLKCRHLTVIANKYSVEQIAGVLERAPNVETLIVDFAFCPSRMAWRKESSLIKESLKTGRIRNIEIAGFSTFCTDIKENRQSLIEVLLRDAQALEKMVINVNWYGRDTVRSLSEVLKVAEEILGCPRGSKAAKVILRYPFKRWNSSAGLT